MRAVRSLTNTAFTLLVLAALVVVLLAYALPQVQVPGLDTTGVEARSLELVHQVVSVVGSTLSGAWNGAVEGFRSAR